jgi:hypothetical protein
MRQRVELARALAGETDILLLDSLLHRSIISPACGYGRNWRNCYINGPEQ